MYLNACTFKTNLDYNKPNIPIFIIFYVKTQCNKFIYKLIIIFYALSFTIYISRTNSDRFINLKLMQCNEIAITNKSQL